MSDALDSPTPNRLLVEAIVDFVKAADFVAIHAPGGVPWRRSGVSAVDALHNVSEHTYPRLVGAFDTLRALTVLSNATPSESVEGAEL